MGRFSVVARAALWALTVVGAACGSNNNDDYQVPQPSENDAGADAVTGGVHDARVDAAPDASLTGADLAITLTDSPAPVAANTTLTYTIDVTNNGGLDATNLVVTNRLPDGNVLFLAATGIGWSCTLAGQIVTCIRPLLIVGAAPSIAITITTPSADAVLVDQASVSSEISDPSTGNNSASKMTTVFSSANLSIVANESPNPVRIGTDLTYTLSVANAGPSAATAISVVDTLPTGTTFVSATGTGWACDNVGQTVTCTRPSLDVPSSAPAISIVATAPSTAATITNTATVNSVTSDPNSANNSVSTATLANVFADLSVTISDSPDPVQGTTGTGCTATNCITYPIDVSNAGPDVATGLRVVILLPTNGSFFNVVGTGWVCPAPTGTTITCTRAATLNANAAAPTISLTWKAPSPGGFSIVVSPTVSSSSTDPDLSNNVATEDTTVRP